MSIPTKPDLDLDQEEADMLRVLLTDHSAWLRATYDRRQMFPGAAEISDRILARVPLFVKRQLVPVPVRLPFQISQQEIDKALREKSGTFGVHPAFEAALGVPFGFDVNFSPDIENDLEPSLGDAVDIQTGDCSKG